MRKVLLLPVLFVLLVTAVFAAMGDNGPEAVAGPEAAIVSGSIVVKGTAAAPEGALTQAQMRVMALRAAKVVALREVSEIIDGVTISGDTRVVSSKAASDVIRTTVEGLIKGAQVTEESYDPQSGLAVVYVSVPMKGEGGIYGQLLPKAGMIYPGGPRFVPSPGAAPGGHDGLIVDVSGVQFRPALINRVVTSGAQVVYDPVTLERETLVSYGAAAYTNDVDKARALLASRGSKNPLVVRASGVVDATDAQITPEAAAEVFSSNLATGFLKAARVVFVLR